MKGTITYKILKDHLISGDLKSGEEITIRIDQTLTQDSTGTMVYLQLEAMNVDRIKTELSVAYIDHNTLQTGFENADDHAFIESVAKRHGVLFSKPGNGICLRLIFLMGILFGDRPRLLFPTHGDSPCGYVSDKMCFVRNLEPIPTFMRSIKKSEVSKKHFYQIQPQSEECPVICIPHYVGTFSVCTPLYSTPHGLARRIKYKSTAIFAMLLVHS
jgi:hypothetical protein